MILDNASKWMGLPVKVYDFEKGASDYTSTLYRIAVDYESKHTAREALEKFLAHPDAGKAPGIVIGLYAPESEGNSAEIVRALVAAKDKLTAVRGIFMNDIISEEQEISWIENSDMAPLLQAYPKLEHFRVRGGNDLALGTLKSVHLKSLVIETGGMDKKILKSIAAAELPNLEHLELWLGTSEYGLTAGVADVEPILKPGKFPALKYLGLRNCEFADALAKLVAKSPVVAQLDVLDLSLGTLGDEGAKELIVSEHLEGLKLLDLHHHYMSDAVAPQFRGLGIEVNLDDPQTADVWDGEAHRYVAVGE